MGSPSSTRRSFLRRSAALGVGLTLPRIAAACVPDVNPSAAPYRYGVASGDPDATSVVLWTRHDPVPGSWAPVPVRWEISTDRSFDTPVANGVVDAAAARDWTVKVVVTGLRPGTAYHYRFRSAVGTSVVGDTRTTPASGAEHVRLGFASCGSYAHGWFHAYRDLAERDDLDAVVHLGDYIYEHASAGFVGNVYGDARSLDPLNEIVSLDDYRRRYAWYRADPDLAELHRRHPMICIWDDHEFANDPVLWGASNHQEWIEGDWSTRVANAARAHAEWMPTRVEDDVAYRAVSFGGLAELVLVDRQRRYLFPSPDDRDEYLDRAQFEWLDHTIATADAPWLLLAPQTTFGAIGRSLTAGGWGDRDRRRVLDAVASSAAGNLVVTVGDVHKFRAMDLALPGAYDPATRSGSAGVEFAVGSVTSPGGPDGDAGPQVRHHDGAHRGTAVLDVTPRGIQMDFLGFADRAKESAERPTTSWLGGFRCADGARHLTVATAPLG